MPFFVRDGVKFHWQERGCGQPFVFQHGLGGDVTQPLGVFCPPEGVHLLALDCRAHGQTQSFGQSGALIEQHKDVQREALALTSESEKLDFATYSADLRAWLDYLDIARTVVGGISMGAAIALKFALEHPARVARLILSRPAWLDEPNAFNVRAYREIAALLRAQGQVDGRATFQASDFFREVAHQSPDAAASLGSQFEAPRAVERVGRLERLPAQSPHPDRDGWAALDMPTLVLATHDDPIHPFAYARTLATTIPGARLRELTSKVQNRALHVAQTQQAIEEFLKEIAC